MLMFPAHLHAQFSYALDNSIPVTIGETALTMPWAGGLNAAQYNTMDLDNDGLDDLVLFDRMANKVITFLRVDNAYQYAPDYERVFPAEIMNWLLLRDYNGDGKKDIFTGDIFGIKVYTNTSSGDAFSWERFFFYSGSGGSKSGALLTKGLSAIKNNLQIQFDDLPAIVDADGDGDLDIFNMIYPNGNTIEFHKNFSQERYGTSDSLDFERQVRNWGGVTECACGEFAFNEDPCNTSGRVEHAGGKSLLAIDINGDATMDIVISEATCSFLSLLKNDGTLASPIITEDSFFPSPTPVDFLNYPAVYFEDVDFDNVKDIIATPNIYSRTYFGTDLKKSNWFYKNTGTNTSPVFNLVQTDFLQNQMIDEGDNVVPAFWDYDADGDLDLLVSSYIHNNNGTIRLFENTGTREAPVYELKDEDYLGLSALSIFNLKIKLADITNDGKTDLVFTATGLFDLVTRLYYIPNQSFNTLSFSLSDRQIISLPSYTIARNENVSVADVNGDGIADLLIGRSNGALNYWKNMGGTSFLLEDPEYLGIGSSVFRQNLSCAVADLDADRKQDLIIGDSNGELRIVSNFRKASNAGMAVSNITWNVRTESYETRNFGGQVWPVVANVFASRKPAIVIGNALGGLHILRHDNEGGLPVKPVIYIFPNPVSCTEPLKVSTDRGMVMEIFSVTGQRITEPVFILPNQTYAHNLFGLSAGIYIARFTSDNKSFVRRFVVY